MIVRIGGVKTVRSKGKVYHYHRKTMKRLPGKPNSSEFMARLRELDAREAAAANLPKTLGALIIAYRGSPEFTGLAPSSKEFYQLVFDRLQHRRDVPIVAIDSAMLYELRDHLAAERTWSFANRTIKVFRLLFAWGSKRGHCTANPAHAVDLVRRPRELPQRNRPWTPAELDTVLQAAPPWLQIPIAVAAYTGLRASDVIAATWAAYDGQSFRARSQKTRVETVVPAHYRLREILDAAPRAAVTIVAKAGKPVTRRALHKAFFALARGLGLDLTFHGLRHTLGSNIVELGGTNEEGAAVLGHLSTRTTAGYSRHANRGRLAARAIERIETRDRRK